MGSRDGDAGIELDRQPAGKPWLSRLVSPCLLDIRTSGGLCHLPKQLGRQERACVPLPRYHQALADLEYVFPRPRERPCPALAGCHHSREHESLSPGLSPIPSGAHTFLVREAAGLRQGCEWGGALPKSFFGKRQVRDPPPKPSSVPKFGHPERIWRGSEWVPGNPVEAWDAEGVSGMRASRGPSHLHQAASPDLRGPPPSPPQNAISRLWGIKDFIHFFSKASEFFLNIK